MDSYSSPPSDSFSPNHPRLQLQRFPSSGLVPPSGLYGVPQGHSYPGLSIQHGSITGNVRNLPTAYLQPKQPVSYRAPVPTGLLESIGQSVAHGGFNLRQQSSVYLPPPTGNVPHIPNGLETLPLQEPVAFNPNLPQALPLIQPARFAGSDCNNGPNLAGSSSSIPALQSTYGVPNVVLDVSQSGFEVAHSSAKHVLTSSYDAPASGDITAQSQQSAQIEVHSPSSSYGPPPSGNPADSLAYDSELKSSSVAVDTVQSDASSTSVVQDTNPASLPGLDGAGLDIVSAKQSHSLEIPVQGALGSYQLQFQSANPLGGQSNEVDGPDHKQLLSEGLLQSILSAIEQPQSNGFTPPAAPAVSFENQADVEQFIHSRVGQDALSEHEPKTE